MTPQSKASTAIMAGTVKLGTFNVNRLGLGAMRLTGPGVWGPPDDTTAAKRLLERAVELEVNFIDTADAYGPDVSEQLICEALQPYEGLIIATKGGMVRGGPGDWRPSGSPDYLRTACAGSLDRLGVDQITLYQLHAPDPAVPFADSIRTLESLQADGMIRYAGLSNVSLEQLQAALGIMPIVSVQNHYNVQHRRDSESILEFCENQGIAFIPYFPMGGDGADDTPLQPVAARHQATTQQIALAWLLAHSPVMLPIPGTASIEHLETNIAAAGITLSAADKAELDALDG